MLMKIKLTEYSETSAHNLQTPANHPHERVQDISSFMFNYVFSTAQAMLRWVRIVL